jgi:hypothetical protein
MQAPIEVSRRGAGEVFSLDILSHRMSEMAILRRLSVRPVFKIPKPAGFFSDVLTFENELGCE